MVSRSESLVVQEATDTFMNAVRKRSGLRFAVLRVVESHKGCRLATAESIRDLVYATWEELENTGTIKPYQIVMLRAAGNPEHIDWTYVLKTVLDEYADLKKKNVLQFLRKGKKLAYRVLVVGLVVVALGILM